MIRILPLLLALAMPALGQAWPERVGEPKALLHEFDMPVADWFGITLSDRMGGEVFVNRDAFDAFAESRAIDAESLRFEARSAHIAGVRQPRDGERADGFRYAVTHSAAPGDDGELRLHRTWFRYRSPAEPRGTAVLMPGMLGTPHQFIDAFENALHAGGWAVVRMLVPPSRATEHLPLAIDLTEPEAPIAQLAAELDDRTAECAYAVEAALAWTDSLNTELAGAPRVLIGMSGTGMMLPAVLAWNEGAFGAAVVIGSGANAFRILRETGYADLLDAVRVTWAPAAPTRDRLAELDAVYLERAELDAYALAPSVNGIPVLLIHGSADRAVPAETGDLLWERLGQPERWTSPVGHELLFLRTLLQIPTIVEWLTERTAEAGP